jgi:hypothetical protein
MINTRITFPELYILWMNTGWMMFTGTLPEAPAKGLTLNTAAANEEWKDEDGNFRPSRNTRMKVVPKIPL